MTQVLAVESLRSIPVVDHSDKSANCELGLEERTQRMREGSDEAWAWFHGRYHFALLRYAGSRTSSADDAMEVVQQAYLRIARHIVPFADEGEFWSWLACVVRCVAVDHARRITRRAALLEKFAHWRQLGRETGSERDPSDNTPRVLADEALSKLPEADARLLRLKYYEGWSMDELATEAGTTAKAIENRLARLRQRLREIILRLE
jgi:RNA polymerase sigma-70 factor (ECF subfamily)